MISKDKTRITISLPNEQVNRIDEFSQKTKMTRSQFIAVAIAILASWDMGKALGNAIGSALDEALSPKKSVKKSDTEVPPTS